MEETENYLVEKYNKMERLPDFPISLKISNTRKGTMKNWFKASDSKMFDLNIFDCFWMEEKQDGFYIYGGSDAYKNFSHFRHFLNQKEAETYLEEIFQKVNK